MVEPEKLDQRIKEIKKLQEDDLIDANAAFMLHIITSLEIFKDETGKDLTYENYKEHCMKSYGIVKERR